MHNLIVATTVMVVAILTALQQAEADYGSLLDKIPVFSSPQRDGSETADSDATLDPPAAPSENSNPSLINPEPRQLTAPGANTQSPESALPAPSSTPRLRSPVPPPRVPDESAGLRSAESMIESDAEHAAETFAPSPLPPSIQFKDIASNPSSVSPPQVSSTSASCGCNACSIEHYGHAGHAMINAHTMTTAHAIPAPYTYTGPGLPPPTSLEAFSRTPDCYRGLWDGYAEEKQRRCVKSHAHLHGYCECHLIKTHHHGHHGGPAPVGQPCGTCAKTLGPSATVVPRVTR